MAGIAAAGVKATATFVFAEAAPKPWAIQDHDRAAFLAAPPVDLPASSHSLRLPTRALGARPNLMLPAKDLRQGPFVAEAELLATADLTVEHEAIEERERTGPPP